MALSEELPIYKASYDLLGQLVDLAKDLPKFYRYTIGTRLVDLCLDILALIYQANMDQQRRVDALTALLVSQRQLLMLLRVLYQQKALSSGRYAMLIKLLDAIGRQGTAWRQKS